MKQQGGVPVRAAPFARFVHAGASFSHLHCPSGYCPPSITGEAPAARRATVLTAVTKLRVSDCIHCDIHDLLDAELGRDGAELAQIAAKVTEVLADLVLTAEPDDRMALLADIVANLGHFVLEKSEQPEAAGGEAKARRH
jgi:hypothetical protein